MVIKTNDDASDDDASDNFMMMILCLRVRKYKNKCMEEKEMRSEYISHRNNIINHNKQVASVRLREKELGVGFLLTLDPFFLDMLRSSSSLLFFDPRN